MPPAQSRQSPSQCLSKALLQTLAAAGPQRRGGRGSATAHVQLLSPWRELGVLLSDEAFFRDAILSRVERVLRSVGSRGASLSSYCRQRRDMQSERLAGANVCSRISTCDSVSIGELSIARQASRRTPMKGVVLEVPRPGGRLAVWGPGTSRALSFRPKERSIFWSFFFVPSGPGLRPRPQL